MVERVLNFSRRDFRTNLAQLCLAVYFLFPVVSSERLKRYICFVPSSLNNCTILSCSHFKSYASAFQKANNYPDM